MVTSQQLHACGIPTAAQLIEISAGFATVDSSRIPSADAVLLINFCGTQQLARMAGEALITEDGEALEGVQIIGVVTHVIRPATFDDYPVM